MSEWVDTWAVALLTTAAGAGAGWWAILRTRQSDRAPATGPDLEELTAKKASYVAQLRELKEQEDRIPANTYAEQRRTLEKAAADILRQLDHHRASAADGATAAGKSEGSPSSSKDRSFWLQPSQLRGFLFGAGGVLLLWLLYPAFVTSPAPAEPTAETAKAEGASADTGELAAIMKRVHEDPNDVQALVRGGALFLRNGRVEQAEWLLNRARGLAPEDPDLLLQIASLQAARGEFLPARATLDSLLEKVPSAYDAWYLRGLIAMQQGDEKTARQSLGEYLARAPEGPKKERLKAMFGGAAAGGQPAAEASPPPTGAPVAP